MLRVIFVHTLICIPNLVPRLTFSQCICTNFPYTKVNLEKFNLRMYPSLSIYSRFEKLVLYHIFIGNSSKPGSIAPTDIHIHFGQQSCLRCALNSILFLRSVSHTLLCCNVTIPLMKQNITQALQIRFCSREPVLGEGSWGSCYWPLTCLFSAENPCVVIILQDLIYRVGMTFCFVRGKLRC